VAVHGGGWIVGGPYLKLWYACEFARRGYAAAAIDYRKLPRHPFPRCLHDAKAAVRWMRANAHELGVDPERIGVFGDSAGGHLALLLAATRPEDGLEGPANVEQSTAVQACASIYGVADLKPYIKSEVGPVAKAAAVLVLGLVRSGDGDALERAASASPTDYVRPGMPPVLLIHAENDPLVPCRQSQQFQEKARALDNDVELHLRPRGGHGFDYLSRAARDETFRLMVEFFDQRLKAAS
jgi:acetyl esterase/lipase